MITISLCMIVKDEEAILARCLDSLAPLMDEIIIVDTGSVDRTKEIAAQYTDQVYDFTWTSDFAAARNYSFSKASMEYIYVADADELLDEENQRRFSLLKESLLPEVEIVQMKYLTRNTADSAINYSEELRAKLFRRIRCFTWIDPIHETVRLDPVVLESDVEVIHLPQSLHSKRNFKIFLRAFQVYGFLTDKLHHMYAKELLLNGENEDFREALPVFHHSLYYQGLNQTQKRRKEAFCVLARAYRMDDLYNEFFKLTLKDMVSDPCSEICCELGHYFFHKKDYEEAALWFYNAAYEAKAILDARTNGSIALSGLAECYEIQGRLEEAAKYKQAASEWMNKS